MSGERPRIDGHTPRLCDDGEEPYSLCEASVFHGRNDEWFVLEWWGDGIGFVVFEAAPTLYACDSGPMEQPSPGPKLAAKLEADGRA